MAAWHRLRAAIRNLFRRSRVDRDLREELRAYVALAADEAEAAGEPRERALRTGRLQLGGIESVTESVRAHRAGAAFERLLQDVRYAWRGLRRTPGFTAAVALLLAFGIGANTAVFSVIDAAIFEPLPYRHPDELVELVTVTNRGTPAESGSRGGLTYWPQIDAWRRQPQIFADVATYGSFTAVKTVNASPVPRAMTVLGSVSPGLLAMLGVPPLYGRWFLENETAANAILLAEPFWRRTYNARPNVIGEAITINDETFAIVGIMPARFSWPTGSGDHVIGWKKFDESYERRIGTVLMRRGDHTTEIATPGAQILLRLRRGLSPEQARPLVARAGKGAEFTMPSAQVLDFDVMPLDMRQVFMAKTRTAVAVFFGAVTCVLLIACANIANLLLARLTLRQREFAVRAALGASRGRVIRQVVTEGLVLASIAGAGAALLAAWAISAVPALVPPELGLFNDNPLEFDGRTLTFCVCAVLATGLLCSLLPALRAGKASLRGGLDSSSRVAGETRSGRRLRSFLQAFQMALALLLLCGAALLNMSFFRMMTAEDGYDIPRLGTLSISLFGERYRDRVAQQTFFDDLIARVRRLPGIHAAYGPAPANGSSGRFVAYGRDTSAPGDLSVFVVDPEYFAVAGIPLESGRWFTSADGPTAPPVAIIDERAAAENWPGESPIGQRFRCMPDMPWTTVVGVVGHVKTPQFTSPSGTIQAYFPISQSAPQAFRRMLVRADEGDPMTGVAAVRDLVARIDPDLDVRRMGSVSEMYARVFDAPRFHVVVMSLLSFLALLTACVGLYAVLNYSVGRRSREIGVRMALGADNRRLRRLIVREAMAPVAGGLLVGLAASWWLARYLAGMLYDVTPHDALTLGLACLTLVGVAAVAAFVPANRATRIDAVETLRAE